MAKEGARLVTLKVGRYRFRGFLADSSEVSELESVHLDTVATTVYRTWNDFSHRVLFGVGEGERSPHQLAAIGLFTRLVEGCQSVFLLLERGLEYDARVLLRVNFETLVLLLNACKDPEFLEAYLDADDVERLKVAKAALRMENSSPEERSVAERERMRIEERKQRNEIRDRDLGSLARRANLSSLFDSVWRLTSSQVHVSPRAIHDYFVVSSSSGEIELAYGPSSRKKVLLLDTLSDFLKMASGSIAKFFDRDELLQAAQAIHDWVSEQRGRPSATTASEPGPRPPQGDEVDRIKLLEDLNRAYAALRQDADAWEALESERRTWDATLADALAEDGPGDAREHLARLPAKAEER